MYASKFVGHEVYDKNGKYIGRLVDLKLDLTSGFFESILVKTGITRKCEVKVSDIESVGERVILKIEREELEKSLAAARA